MNPAESDAIRILGVRIDRVTYAEALAHVEVYLSEGGFHQIATVNPEFVVLAQQDAAFRGVLNATALNVPDGVGLLWAARRLGQPLPGRVTGQELVDRIAARAARTGERVFMLGARPGVAEKAGAELVRRYPPLVIAGCYAGSPALNEERDILERIQAARAAILFVAYGPPKQEMWIARNTVSLDVKLAMGVGGTFDTLAGIVPRAPAWVQRAGYEWAFRLCREPHRIKRQMAIPYFMWLITKYKWTHPAPRS